MTEVCLSMPFGTMDTRGAVYSTAMPYLDTYISPSPSVYPSSSYETSPPLQSAYLLRGQVPGRSPQDWNQDGTLFSHTERAIAKERRREQNRASQRAYRKRKEDTVKGLYDSVKDLRKDSDSLKAENDHLKETTRALRAELEKLQAENRELRSRPSTVHSCTQCTEAGLPCSKSRSTCMRCEEAGLTCTSPTFEMTGRHPTIEYSDAEDCAEDTAREADSFKSGWYQSQNRIPIISATDAAEEMSNYSMTSYSQQTPQERHCSPYEYGEEDEQHANNRQSQDGFPQLLQPNSRPTYRAQSLGLMPMANEQTRPRSSSLYDTTGP